MRPARAPRTPPAMAPALDFLEPESKVSSVAVDLLLSVPLVVVGVLRAGTVLGSERSKETIST